MSRTAGITASAVVALLGSIFTLALGVMVVVATFLAPPQSQLPNNTQMALAGAAIMVAFGSFGIWTAVGVFRLRPWARTSIVVFAGFTAAWSIFGMVMMSIVPVPPEIPLGIVRLIMGVMFGVPLAISAWWLIQFNAASTKAAFAFPTSGTESLRPLSITIIGWLFVLGTGSCGLLILLRQPGFFFGAVFNGWVAGVFYAFFGVLSFYIGKGLLDPHERARILAIAWFGLWFVQMGFVSLVPSLRNKLFALQRTLEQNQPRPIAFDEVLMTKVGLGLSGIFVAAAIWFLVRGRAAFAGRIYLASHAITHDFCERTRYTAYAGQDRSAL